MRKRGARRYTNFVGAFTDEISRLYLDHDHDLDFASTVARPACNLPRDMTSNGTVYVPDFTAAVPADMPH